MPRATIGQETIHKDLTSLPEGWVELRRMPYGQWLHRQELAMRMQVEAQTGGRNNQGLKGQVVMANQEVTNFEFAQCVADHNLENDAGEKLDFRSKQALALLDPKIGNEIAQYIMELHEFDAGNSSSGSNSS